MAHCCLETKNVDGTTISEILGNNQDQGNGNMSIYDTTLKQVHTFTRIVLLYFKNFVLQLFFKKNTPKSSIKII